MIKVLTVRHTGPWKQELEFSDQANGQFNAQPYLAERQGPLLDALRDAAYFNQVFADAGGLCWPNGLELSAARLRELVNRGVDA